jgi:hypothetical protein
MTLTNIQLENLAIEYNIPNFKCIMNNELPKKPMKNANYVVNLENNNESGSHWCVVLVRNGKKLYGDSFGCVPTLEVTDFFHKSKGKYMFNSLIVQDLHSNDCGLFALGLIIYCHIGDGDLFTNGDNYYNMFNPVNLKQNDKIIKNLFRTHFRS